MTMAYVAAGRLDACFEEGSWIDDTGPKIWDLAPGTLIVREAGGITRDVSHRKSKGEPLEIMQRSLFAAATTELADALVETIYNCKA